MTKNLNKRLLLLGDAQAAHTIRWCNWFTEAGWQVNLVTFTPPPNDVNFPVHDLGFRRFARPIRMVLAYLSLRRLMTKIGPSVIHAHSAGSYAWLPYFARARPLMITPWGSDVLLHAKHSRTVHLLTKRSLVGAQEVSIDGEHLLPVMKQFGVDEAKIFLHSFGTDCKVFYPGNSLDPRSTPFTFVSTRTLTDIHDVQTTITAFLNLADKWETEVRLLVVGGGGLSSDLRQLTNSSESASKVTFTGPVDELGMSSILRSANVYVSSSPHDAGLAASTAEAMASGLPVLHTRVGDNARWADGGDGGYTFEPGDVQHLTSLMLQMARMSQDELQVMGRRNRSLVLAENNIDIEMAKVSTRYDQLAHLEEMNQK